MAYHQRRCERASTAGEPQERLDAITRAIMDANAEVRRERATGVGARGPEYSESSEEDREYEGPSLGESWEIEPERDPVTPGFPTRRRSHPGRAEALGRAQGDRLSGEASPG